MNNIKKDTSRRDFLRIAAFGMGGLTLGPLRRLNQDQDFPTHDRLGRAFARTDIKIRPDIDSETIATIFDDTVVAWLREVVGRHPFRYKQRWVETPDGYIWAPDLQPVRNEKVTPVRELPQTSLGPGMWVEVCVPWVDIILENKPISPGFRAKVSDGLPLRLYYSQILWVDQLRVDDDGEVWYRVKERFGYGDIIWARGEAFRPLSSDECAPINPEVENKLVIVNVEERYQSLSCFEGDTEVYFCRISAGKKFDAEGKFLGESSTPKGTLNIWRKQLSTHMSGGTTGAGYDLPGIGWTALFSGDGVAIHSTFWHNNFGGELMSHGCVNAAPEDAKWIFRWTNPPVYYDPGDLYSKDTDIPPTKVKVLEA